MFICECYLQFVCVHTCSWAYTLVEYLKLCLQYLLILTRDDSCAYNNKWIGKAIDWSKLVIIKIKSFGGRWGIKKHVIWQTHVFLIEYEPILLFSTCKFHDIKYIEQTENAVNIPIHPCGKMRLRNIATHFLNESKKALKE